MNLVIDAGNTSIKAAVFKANEIIESIILDDLNMLTLAPIVNKHEITSVIYATTRNLKFEQVRQLFNAPVLLFELTKTLPVPVKIDYATPETLGKDRLAAAVGAAKMFPGHHVVIIDMGTAITIDHITDKGIFSGGIISPGMEMRFKALHHFTGKLPLLFATNQWQLTGKSTLEAIQFGVLNGIEFEINTYIERYTSKYSDVKMILTGGDAPRFRTKISGDLTYEKFLVLHGLNEILNFNIG